MSELGGTLAQRSERASYRATRPASTSGPCNCGFQTSSASESLIASPLGSQHVVVEGTLVAERACLRSSGNWPMTRRLILAISENCNDLRQHGVVTDVAGEDDIRHA